jgi:hypothetical protein
MGTAAASGSAVATFSPDIAFAFAFDLHFALATIFGSHFAFAFNLLAAFFGSLRLAPASPEATPFALHFPLAWPVDFVAADIVESECPLALARSPTAAGATAQLDRLSLSISKSSALLGPLAAMSDKVAG